MLANVSVACLHTALKASFEGILAHADAQSLSLHTWMQLSQALRGCWGRQRVPQRLPLRTTVLTWRHSTQSRRASRKTPTRAHCFACWEMKSATCRTRSQETEVWGCCGRRERSPACSSVASTRFAARAAGRLQCNGCGPRIGAAFTTSSGGAAGHIAAEPGSGHYCYFPGPCHSNGRSECGRSRFSLAHALSSWGVVLTKCMLLITDEDEAHQLCEEHLG